MNAITMPSSRAYSVVDHTYDVVVVGAGGPACAPPSAWERPV